MPAEFIGELVTRIDKRVTKTAFELVEPLTYITSYGFATTVPAGFRTDLESLPWFVRMFESKGGPVSWAAVGHDYLYKTHIITRLEADRIFLEAMITLGEPRFKARLFYWGVRVGGARGWRKDAI